MSQHDCRLFFDFFLFCVFLIVSVVVSVNMGDVDSVAAKSVRVIIYLFASGCDSPDSELINMPSGSYSFSRLRATVVPQLSGLVEFTSHQIRAGEWFVLPKPPTTQMDPVLEKGGKFCIMDKGERDVDGSKCIVVDLRGRE